MYLDFFGFSRFSNFFRILYSIFINDSISHKYTFALSTWKKSSSDGYFDPLVERTILVFFASICICLLQESFCDFIHLIRRPEMQYFWILSKYRRLKAYKRHWKYFKKFHISIFKGPMCASADSLKMLWAAGQSMNTLLVL